MYEKLNLENPTSFTEKIQWLKLRNTNSLYSKMVDKYECRKIITKELGKEYLIPLIGVWDDAFKINFNELPEQFVLKTTHDSGSLIICKGKAMLDVKDTRRRLNKALRRNYFYKSREYPYKNAIPRIIGEKYMHDPEQEELNDYKFFCFDGEPKFVHVTTGKGKTKNSVFFDMNFNPLPFTVDNNLCSPDIINRPIAFDKMVEISRKLSKGLKHIRIDLYYINKKIYFGEFTFHNAGGIMRFSPPEWDNIIGEMLDINKL